MRASLKNRIAYTLSRNDLIANRVITEHGLVGDRVEHFIEVELPLGLKWPPDGTYLAFTGRKGGAGGEKGTRVYVWVPGSDRRLVACLGHGRRFLGECRVSTSSSLTGSPSRDYMIEDCDYV